MASSGLINLNKYKEAFKQTSNAIQKTISGQNNQGIVPTESLDVLSGIAQAGAQAVGAVAQTADCQEVFHYQDVYNSQLVKARPFSKKSADYP